MHLFCIACLPTVYALIGVDGKPGLPATEVRTAWVWHPQTTDNSSHQPLLTLTDAGAVKAVNKFPPQYRAPPPFTVSVAVGRPAQVLSLALDTTGGTTWLIDVGSQAAQEGDLNDVVLYRSLRSNTVQYVATAEVRPRVRFPLGPIVPNGEIVGRLVSDSVLIVDATIPLLPLVLAEKVPLAALAWQVGGVLGLGLRGGATAPLFDLWRTAWINGPAGTAATPAELAERDVPPQDGFQRAPVVSIWPQAGDAWNDDMMRLGLGKLDGATWVPLAAEAIGWVTEAHVAVDAGPRSTQLPSRWSARLLVDTTLPALGVPSQHFASVMHALLPNGIAQLCTYVPAAVGLQVHCHCSAAKRANALRVEIAGKVFSLMGHDLFIFSGEMCTARIWPIAEPGEVWHLGEPFLRRFGVTLDAPRRRLGFAPAPPQGLANLVDEDARVDRFVQPSAQKSTFNHLGRLASATMLFTPIAFFFVLAVHILFLSFRGALGRWERRELLHREYIPVPTTPPDSSDAEDIGWDVRYSIELGSDSNSGTTFLCKDTSR